MASFCITTRCALLNECTLAGWYHANGSAPTQARVSSRAGSRLHTNPLTYSSRQNQFTLLRARRPHHERNCVRHCCEGTFLPNVPIVISHVTSSTKTTSHFLNYNFWDNQNHILFWDRTLSIEYVSDE